VFLSIFELHYLIETLELANTVLKIDLNNISFNLHLESEDVIVMEYTSIFQVFHIHCFQKCFVLEIELEIQQISIHQSHLNVLRKLGYS
jgi:hypothetical protein